MKYIALLRGVNISGKNKVPMKELKTYLEDLNYKNVTTYLNSGNIIFDTNQKPNEIEKNIKTILKDKLNVDTEIYITTKDLLEDLLNNQPDWWGKEDKQIYDNIIFIIPPKTYNEVYNILGIPNQKLEKIKEYKNNIFWSYILKEYRKTNWWSKTAQKDVNKYITIRTANTIKKVLEIARG